MKKRIIKIWGVSLALVMVFSLIFSAAPVSAGTLSWGDEDLPDELELGTDIVDMAVSGDGSTIYITAAGVDSSTGYGVIYRSTNNGESWTSIQVHDGTDSLNTDHIAVTPDDPNYIAVSDNNSEVMISDDAGANWDTLHEANTNTNFQVYDLAISVEKGGNHFVAVCGIDTTDNDGEVHSYEIGAIGANWEEISITGAPPGGKNFPANQDIVGAIAFSPNFYSDQVLVAISADYTGEHVWFQVYSYNQGNWNSGAFTDFPEDLLQDDPSNLASLDAAVIAMAPDYLGSDEDMRVAFVGLAVNHATDTATDTDGVFRLDNADTEVVKDEKEIYSVAFDGSLLVAGTYSGIDIYRSTDALDDNPSTSSSTGSREPGGTGMVLVGIAGDTVVAGTSGDESAFAYSEDNGKTFNDISMIDTELSTLSDIAVPSDGSVIYLASADNTSDMSLWYYDSRWERIYNNRTAGNDFIIRMAPDDPDVLYLADYMGTDIYFNSGGGLDKWHTRVSKETVEDLAVEGDGDTVYVMTGSGYVSKSTNRGFTWASKVSSKLTGGSSMIMSMGEDKLLAGSQDGRVAYSTDGNTSWTKISNDGFDDSGYVHATATGLSDGDFIIAGCENDVYAWELGEDDEWDAITGTELDGASGQDFYVSGIGLWQGVLYVVAANQTGADSLLLRTLTPTDDSPTWSQKLSGTEDFSAMPQALRISGTDVTKLWAINNVTYLDELFTYKDPLATVGVDLSLPSDAADIPFNTVSGLASQIIFSWKCPSDKITKFNFEIATDSGFNEDVLSLDRSGDWDEGDTISQIIGPGATGEANIQFNPETTYYWRVRVDKAGPVRSAWSETRSFTTGALPEIQPPVIIEQPPAPIIQVPPTPEITIQPPEIVLPAPQPVPEIVIPSAPEPTPPVPQWALLVIIIIGAVLVIALIVLIMRTRRPV